MKKYIRTMLVCLGTLLIIILGCGRCGKKAQETAASPDDTVATAPVPQVDSSSSRPDTATVAVDSAADAEEFKKFPKFPWPPPPATSTVLLPRVFVSGLTTFDAVDEKISKALDKAGYVEKSYYAVPGGFALVTHLEQISVQGDTIASPNRWTQSTPKVQFSLKSIIDQLVHAHPGHFRIIVFIVTPKPFTTGSKPVGLAEAKKWLDKGYDALPSQMASSQLPAGTKCKIHVYQFKKPESDPAIFMDNGVTADVHLRKAGLWSKLNR